MRAIANDSPFGIDTVHPESPKRQPFYYVKKIPLFFFGHDVWLEQKPFRSAFQRKKTLLSSYSRRHHLLDSRGFPEVAGLPIVSSLRRNSCVHAKELPGSLARCPLHRLSEEPSQRTTCTCTLFERLWVLEIFTAAQLLGNTTCLCALSRSS